MSSLTLHNHSPSFADLPAEILVLIASNVGPGDLISLRKVSTRSLLHLGAFLKPYFRKAMLIGHSF